MKKPIIIKLCTLNIICLTLLQMIYIIIEFFKENIATTVELTQSQIMQQMHYSNIQSNFSHIIYICAFLAILAIHVAIKEKKLDEILLINIIGITIMLSLSMIFTVLLKLNFGNVFENTIGFSIILIIFIIIYLIRLYIRKNNFNKTTN